jgi:hypothetical protein
MMTLRNSAALATVFAVALITAPLAAALPCEDSNFDNDPVGQGRFTTAEDVGWIFFKTGAHQSCGIGPDGVIGCDNVPLDAPEGANQIRAKNGQAADYRHSDTPTFTRDVDVLLEGHKLENGPAVCGVGFQGTVSCKTPGNYAPHGFTVGGAYAVLW